MNKKIKVGGVETTITDRNYLGAGGQAAVYRNGPIVYKIYHDKKDMLPLPKIEELSKLTPPNVVVPLHVVYDAVAGDAIGYAMKFLTDTEPLCKYFTKGFKQDNGVTPDLAAALIKRLLLTVKLIHCENVLIVDLNELNVLVAQNHTDPWMIDTDSYQTPSFKATAIMPSVRDPKSAKGFTELSDWFSWGILAFQVYINIHPYKGTHPNYKPAEWQKRMTDGASLFDKGVRLPAVCNDFSVVPKRHLDWFKDTFGKNNRSEPPLPDSISPIAVPQAAVVIQGSDKFEIHQIASYPEPIVHVTSFAGVMYVVTKKAVYVGQNKVFERARFKTVLTCVDTLGDVVMATSDGSPTYQFHSYGSISGTGAFARNNAIYTVNRGQLVQNNFRIAERRKLHVAEQVESVSELATHVFDGCLIQDLLGRKYLTIPYALGRCTAKPVPELNGFRVIDAKSERHITVVIAEREGKYDRFIFSFRPDFSTFATLQEHDVAYEGINFTVTDSGVCVLVSGNDAYVFKDVPQYARYDNPPLDATMKLFTHGNGVCFVNDNAIFSLKLK